MKTLLLGLLLATATLAAASERVIELIANTNAPAVYFVPEGKLVTVIGKHYIGPALGFVKLVQQYAGRTDTNDFGSFSEIGNTVPGPATVTLIYQNPYEGRIARLLLREWSADVSSAETTPVIPAGTGAVLRLEASTDLATWAPVITTNIPPAETNRFWRLKLDLTPRS
jgi:hypothetical protein